jgi:hypothetical protein
VVCAKEVVSIAAKAFRTPDFVLPRTRSGLLRLRPIFKLRYD